MARRVVVTGMGAVTPLGSTVDTFWDNIRKGQCGIKMITKFDTEEFKVKVAGEVEGFDPELYMTKKDVKRNDLFAVYALGAAVQAFEDSGLDMEKEDSFRVGVIVGSGIGSLPQVENNYEKILTKGPGKVNPLMVPMMISLAHLSMRYTSGTSLVAVMILAVPGVITQAMLGNVDWIAGAAVACGSIPGAMVGAKLVPKVPERTLRFMFSFFLVVAAVLLVVNQLGVWG